MSLNQFKLFRISKEPATDKQIAYLDNLGYQGDPTKLSKREASDHIGALLEERKKNPRRSRGPTGESTENGVVVKTYPGGIKYYPNGCPEDPDIVRIREAAARIPVEEFPF